MSRKQNKPRDEDLVTYGQLKKELSYRFGRFRKTFGEEIRREIKDESHRLEFRLNERMDKGFSELREEMKKQTDTFQKLADIVIREHKDFELGSASTRHNYQKLEERVTTVEKIVLPAQHT